MPHQEDKIQFGPRSRGLSQQNPLREDFQSVSPDRRSSPPWSPLEKCLAVVIVAMSGYVALNYFGPKIKESFSQSFGNNPISQLFSLTFPSK